VPDRDLPAIEGGEAQQVLLGWGEDVVIEILEQSFPQFIARLIQVALQYPAWLHEKALSQHRQQAEAQGMGAVLLVLAAQAVVNLPRLRLGQLPAHGGLLGERAAEIIPHRPLGQPPDPVEVIFPDAKQPLRRGLGALQDHPELGQPRHQGPQKVAHLSIPKAVLPEGGVGAVEMHDGGGGAPVFAQSIRVYAPQQTRGLGNIVVTAQRWGQLRE